MGEVLAGVCDFDASKYQKKKELRRGTRVGSVAIYCCREAFADAGIDLEAIDRSRVGVYLGVTEHGNVETENEVHNISKYDYDTKYWSHHHNPRTVANNPAGEVTLNMKITGPHYTIGAACAAGNMGVIQGVQMLRLGEADLALLRIAGLFDRPADGELVEVLKDAAIAGLTEPLAGLAEKDWKRALNHLRKARLLAEEDPADKAALDAHPLIREYFGDKLRDETPEAWRAGHDCLYKHLTKTADELPETAEAMVPPVEIISSRITTVSPLTVTLPESGLNGAVVHTDFGHDV